MTQRPDELPEELFRAESVPAEPRPINGPDVFGLPGLPKDVLDVIVHYGPVIALAAAAFNGFGSVSLALQSTYTPALAPYVAASAILGMAASAVLLTSYVYLILRRRTGWNLLAIALGMYLLSHIVALTPGAIAFTAVEVLAAAYLMLQIREYYT